MIILPEKCVPEPPLDFSDGWQSVETIPRDRVIEVDAPPHNGTGAMMVQWSPGNHDRAGIWVFEPRRGGLMVPICPIRWREVPK
jgi:hypothetical protein